MEMGEKVKARGSGKDFSKISIPSSGHDKAIFWKKSHFSWVDGAVSLQCQWRFLNPTWNSVQQIPIPAVQEKLELHREHQG